MLHWRCFGSSIRWTRNKSLRDVAVGDVIETRDFTSAQKLKARVAFISKPPRRARPLYETNDIPGVRFTGTHPIVLRTASCLPVLGFVDQWAAMGLNPTWQSLPREQLDLFTPYTTSKHDEETLYDLILESTDGTPICAPATYVLCNADGKQMEVASEAPIMEWYPYALRFFYAMTSM
jgi:hypothetical protein